MEDVLRPTVKRSDWSIKNLKIYSMKMDEKHGLIGFNNYHKYDLLQEIPLSHLFNYLFKHLFMAC